MPFLYYFIFLKDGRLRPSLAELMVNADRSVDIELLLVHGRIALHDDRALGHFFHLVQQAAIVGLQFLGYVGMHAQHNVLVFEMLGDLPHLHVDLIANGGDGLHIAGRLAVRTGRADRAFERLLHALAGDGDQSEVVKLQRL